VLDVAVSILDITFLAILLYVMNFYTRADCVIFSSSLTSVLHPYPLAPIAAFFILFSIKNFFGFIVFKKQYHFVFDVASRISLKNLLSYLEGNFKDYVNIDSSIYIRRMSNQPIEFAFYVLRGVQQIFSQSILIFLTIIAIVIYNPIFFALLFLILVPPVFLLAFLLKKKLGEAKVSIEQTSEKAYQHLQEALSGYVESCIYDKIDFFSTRYYTFQKKLNHFLSQQQIIQNMPSRLIEVFAIFGLFILIVIHTYTTGLNSINIITIGAFMAAAYKIIPGIVKILNSVGQVKTYFFTISNLSVPSHDTAFRGATTTSVNMITSVKFEDVSFSYQEKILDKLSFEMLQGDFVGLAGISGRGKTTIINLLLGFLTPACGSISIDNKRVEAKELKTFWKNISYVKQQPFLIHDTILKNITLDDKEYNKEKLLEVIAITGVDKLTEKLPEGLDTVITENGKNLSGGQRQRIILSRAFYKEANLIILDEPFNELDEQSEVILLKYLQRLSQEGKIILLITHNKSALSFCTKTILLNE
jgi:ABC-type bacteriocin/lantibiotic exporter with double-glycine peptidase domain